MADKAKVDLDKIQEVKNNVNVQSDEDANGNPIPKGSTLFTKREWTMRYAAPFKALMFMAAPMVIIMIVNSLYGIIDKQLALNYAKKMVINMFSGVPTDNPVNWITGVMHNNAPGTIFSGAAGFDMDHFAEVLINVSTQYSNTIITLLSAMSLLTSVGTAIKWGQAMGERNKERMDAIVVMGLIQTLIMSGVGIVLLHFVGPYIISSQADTAYGARATSVIFALSNQYTQMYIYGFPLLAFATFISTLIRTEGKVWWVIAINVTAICLNIGCGEAFLKASAPAQAMQSAVYGSFIAWGWMIVVGLGVILTSKNTLLMPDFKHLHLKLKDAGIIWLYGISPFVANFIFAVANYVTTLLITIAHTGSDVQNTIIVYWWNQLPGTNWQDHIHAIGKPFYITPALQSMSSAFPWMNILYAPLLGMMQGANANYAYCKGAGKRFRMIQIWRIHLMINMIWGVCVLIIVAAAGAPMMEAFGYGDPGIHRWWFFGYICGIVFGGMTYAALSLFQGTGDSFNATLVAILRSLVCNVGFVVIGWAIAKAKSTNGSGDWVIFIMNGLCEIPATIVGMIIVARYFHKLIKKYMVNDLPDSFVAPSLLTAAQNEVTIWQDSLSGKARKSYLRKIEALKKNGKLTAKLQAKLDKKLEFRLETLAYKADYKMAKATERYRFRNQSLGNGTGDIKAKQLMEWRDAKEYDLLMSDSLDYEQAQKDIDAVYEKKLAELHKSTAKKLAYLQKIESGDKVLNPFTLLFVGQEPQPLNRKEEVIASEEKARAMRKQKELAALKLHKRHKLINGQEKPKKVKKIKTHKHNKKNPD